MTGPSLTDVFNSTSADFDAVTPEVWGPAGTALAAAAGLRAGDRVLDICCGTGASALAAARLVGPEGAVTAVDFAAELIERARRTRMRRDCEPSTSGWATSQPCRSDTGPTSTP